MISVAGFDPGATTGWCILHEDKGRAHYVNGGACRDFGRLEWLDHLSLMDVSLVAIERPIRIYAKDGFGARMAGHLAEANYIAGRIEGRAAVQARDVVTFEAGEWRKAIVGKNNPSDAEVKAAVMPRITGAPARLSAHVRDAIGVALFAAMRSRLRRSA